MLGWVPCHLLHIAVLSTWYTWNGNYTVKTCSSHSDRRPSHGEGVEEKGHKGPATLTSGNVPFYCAIVDADFGKDFPKDWKGEDDQTSLDRTILPGERLFIPCGGARNKETEKESLLCWHGMALRMRQRELEEKPAGVKVLFNDGKCYYFHREQALVNLPQGAQLWKVCPFHRRPLRNNVNLAAMGHPPVPQKLMGNKLRHKKKKNKWSQRRKLKLGSALSRLVYLRKTWSRQQKFHRDRSCSTSSLGYQSTICLICATTLELVRAIPKRLRNCKLCCIAGARLSCKSTHCLRQLPQECVLTLLTWGPFLIEAQQRFFFIKPRQCFAGFSLEVYCHGSKCNTNGFTNKKVVEVPNRQNFLICICALHFLCSLGFSQPCI